MTQLATRGEAGVGASKFPTFARMGQTDWIADTVNATVKQVTIPWVKDSIQVFQGDFTCCHRKHEGMECCDKEKLVAPILGLFGAAYELRTMHPEIYQMLMEQPDMFPETHTYEKEMENGKVVKHVKHLFGDLLDS